MATNNLMATVSSVTGEVYARDSEGQLRQLKTGDQLNEGDVVIPSNGGSVELSMADGSSMALNEPVEVTLSKDMLSDEYLATQEEEAVTDESVAAVLEAIEAGQDPTEVLQAPAAGEAAGEGHDFVRLARVVENVSPNDFPGDTPAAGGEALLSPDLLDQAEGEPPIEENDAPVATDNGYTLDEGGSIGGNIITDDTGHGADSDADGDSLTIASINGVPVVFDGDGKAEIGIGDGILTIYEDGTFSYDHNGDEPEGDISFSYTVSDGSLESNSATVTLIVEPVNDPPVAEDNEYTVIVDGDGDGHGGDDGGHGDDGCDDGKGHNNGHGHGGIISGNIITDDTGSGVDSDPENDPLTIATVNGEALQFNQDGYATVELDGGTLTINRDGEFRFEFDHHDDGVDGKGQGEGHDYSDGQGHDEHGEGHGYGHDHGDCEHEEVSFTYTVTDGQLESNTATVILHPGEAGEVNDPPVAEDNEYTVIDDGDDDGDGHGGDGDDGCDDGDGHNNGHGHGGAISGNIITDDTGSGVDSDPENDPLSIATVNGDAVEFNQDGYATIELDGGTLTINRDGEFSFEFDHHDDGVDGKGQGKGHDYSDGQGHDEHGQGHGYGHDHGDCEQEDVSFTYTITDGQLESNTATVILHPGGGGEVNDPPVAEDNEYTVIVDGDEDGDEGEDGDHGDDGCYDGGGHDNGHGHGGTISGNIITDDTGSGVDSDPENDPLSIATVNGETVVFNPDGYATIELDGGTLTINQDGEFTFEFNHNDGGGDGEDGKGQGKGHDHSEGQGHDEHGQGHGYGHDHGNDDSGQEEVSFTYTITDGQLESNTAAVTLTQSYDDEGGSGSDCDEHEHEQGSGKEYSTVISGEGDDLLIGGPGSDTFAWKLNDGGYEGGADHDVITGFDSASPGSGGDVLDLSELLVSEENEELSDYLHFDLNDDGDTVLNINTKAGFAGGYDSGAVEQSIQLSGVDLVSAYTDIGSATDQTALIQSLVDTGKLITD